MYKRQTITRDNKDTVIETIRFIKSLGVKKFGLNALIRSGRGVSHEGLDPEMCIRDSIHVWLSLGRCCFGISGLRAHNLYWGSVGNIPVSYTHLDVYKRQ